MADIVSQVLRDAAEKAANLSKSVIVHKNLELDLDLGHLLATDNNPINPAEYMSGVEEFLKNLARDNTQILLNKLWELPAERNEDAIVVKLPPPLVVLPREKRVPKDKAPTKWEEYSQKKGLRKQKKAKLVWDEVIKDWKPRYGYRRQVGTDAKDWMIEVPANADPYEDQFAKKSEKKKERVAKNELQRLRNIARSRNVKVPGVGLTPTDTKSKSEVTKAISFARKSTASLGKFNEAVKNEDRVKDKGKKRKFEPLIGDSKQETEKSLNILNKLSNKRPKLDVSKAINKEAFDDTKDNKSHNKSFKTKGKKTGFKKGGRNDRKGKGGGFKGGDKKFGSKGGKGKGGGGGKGFGGNKSRSTVGIAGGKGGGGGGQKRKGRR